MEGGTIVLECRGGSAGEERSAGEGKDSGSAGTVGIVEWEEASSGTEGVVEWGETSSGVSVA